MKRKSIVGVFVNDREAKQVAEDLKHQGFSGSDIHVVDQQDQKTQSWFSHLFGANEEQEALAYREALRHGQAVVAVEADGEKADRAAEIMKSHTVGEQEANIRVIGQKSSKADIPIEIATDFRRNFATQYGGRDYSEYEIAYRIGYLSEPHGQSFDQVEPQLRDELTRRNPHAEWRKMRDAVRYGFDRRNRKS